MHTNVSHTRGIAHRVMIVIFAAVLAQPVWLWAQAGSPPPFSSPSPSPADAARPPLDGENVVDIRFQGNQIPSSKLYPLLKLRKGREFSFEIVEEDVRRLLRSRLVVDVKPLYEPVQGGVVVIYRVVERPIIREIVYEGLTSRWLQGLTEKRLDESIGLKVGDAVDPIAINEGAKRIQELYRNKGFNHVHVTVKEGLKTGDRRVVYVIHEGPKQQVTSISFVGNQVVSGARLMTQIQTKAFPVFNPFFATFDPQKLDNDVDRLVAYYHGLGYWSVRVGREVDYNSSKTGVYVRFVIDEGPRFQVREITFVGNEKFNTQRLAEHLELQEKEPFLQTDLEQDLSYLRDLYGSQGYIFADIRPDIRYLEEPGKLDIVYRIDEGAQYRVGRIHVRIKGEYPHTRITTVLNRLSIKPGDIVDIRELRASERRLKASGLFLNNPAQGSAPKIVFGPPSVGGSNTRVADDPRTRGVSRGPSSRGQSPLPGNRTTRWKIDPQADSAPVRPGQRFIDVTLDGEWIEQPTTPANLQQQKSYYQRRPAPSGDRQWQEPSAPRQHARDSLAQNSGPPRRRGYVARAQWGDSGRLTPQPPPAGISPRRQPPVTRYSPYPPSNAGQVIAPPGSRPFRPQPVPQQRYAQPTSPQPRYVPPVPRGQTPSGGPNLPPSGTNGPVEDVLPGGPTPQQGTPPAAPDGAVVPPLAEPWELGPTQDFTVEVEETQTGRLMFGVGINSDAGLVGNIVIDEQNFDWRRVPTSWGDFRSGRAFRGAGQRFRMEAVPGTQVSRYLASFTEPYLFDTAWSLSLSGSYYDRIFEDWDEQRKGGRIAVGRNITHDLSLTFAVRGEEVTITDPAVPTPMKLADALGDNTVVGFEGALVHDTRDSPFLATEGHYFQTSFEQVVGSFSYPRWEAEWRQYWLLYQRADGSGRNTLSFRVQTGISGSNTPIYDAFYAGGARTLRGFDFRGANPHELGVSIGGNFLFITSVEYMVPLTANDMIRAVAFVDAGTVEESVTIDRKNFRVAPGLGLRIFLPMLGPAPLAFDFAVPISDAAGDEKRVFTFSVGVGG